MSTNKLYLFSKDTDATATELGYHYQKLKTLKTWLQNRIANIDEVIYCDYGDDIVQRNFQKGTTKFRQVKLYATNFSFSTEEITKSIANFFMLFTKGDYLFDEATFVFETNSKIAKDVRGNDADLLREWEANQGKMDDELTDKIIDRVKTIIDAYIIEGYEKEKLKDTSGEFLRAKNYYEQLPDDFWRKFVLAIRWQFDGVSKEEAILQLVDEIQGLILQLPLPINEAQVSTYLAVLHYEIAKRTTESDPNERILTNELLDVLVLNNGDETNQWYAEVFQRWSTVTAINTFSLGSFLEVIDAARHCRWNLHGSEHSVLWLKHLKSYIALGDIPMIFKRQAIYEYLFLKMSTDMHNLVVTGSIADEGELVNEYFENMQERYSLAGIEEDIALLQVVTAQKMMIPEFIDGMLIKKWGDLITDEIEKKLSSPRDINEQCQLLELKGTTIMQLRLGYIQPDKVNAAVTTFREIVPLLPEAKQYTITSLSQLLEKLIKLYIQVGEGNEKIIDQIDTFLQEITDAAQQTGKRHSEAHSFVERGVAYMEKGGAKNFLRALDAFHKAGSLWLMNDTTDGHVLALLNIAQLFNALGANFAGKYYGLCAIWAAENVGDASMLKRVSDGYSLVFHSDFQHGAWLSAIGDYFPFMNMRLELAGSRLDTDEMVIKNFIDLLLIMETAEYIHTPLTHLINFHKMQLGTFYSEEMQHLVVEMKANIEKTTNLNQFVADRTDDTPFNDVGSDRVIRFKMLGIEWRLHFSNSYILTGLAEEFAALLQITLCEIGLSGRDLQLNTGIVNIDITQAAEGVQMATLTKTDRRSWSLQIPFLNEHNPDKTRWRYASLAACIKGLLKELSNTSNLQFEEIFDNLYKKQKLGDKGLSVTGYQRAFFKAFEEDNFNHSQRQHFPAPADRFGQELRDRLSDAISHK